MEVPAVELAGPAGAEELDLAAGVREVALAMPAWGVVADMARQDPEALRCAAPERAEHPVERLVPWALLMLAIRRSVVREQQPAVVIQRAALATGSMDNKRLATQPGHKATELEAEDH